MINIIVAQSKNRVIGKNNKLLLCLPEELKNFKKYTKDKIVVMGRKTLESIGRSLPDRRNIVLTRQKNFSFNHVEVHHSWDSLGSLLKSEKEIFIIGGTEIYQQALKMDIVDKIYLTTLEKEFEGDAYFPKLDNKIWKVDYEKKHPETETNSISWTFQILSKNK